MDIDSQLKFISVAMVATNKVRESKIIECTPYELIPQQNGELSEETTIALNRGIDSHGQQFQASIEFGETVKATWLGDGHLDTAPDVQRGETVHLLRYADTELYFWTCPGSMNHLRRLETVRYFWSNESDINKDIDKLNADNSYGFEVSTHDKHITLTTNKNDGEPFAYLFQINTKDGNFTFTDDAKNVIQVDSKNKVITLHNNCGTYLRLDKKDIIGYAPDSWYMEAVNNIEFTCGKDMTFKVGGNYTKTVGGNYNTDVSGNFFTKAGGGVTFQSPTVTMDTPLTTCTAHLVAASLAIGGGGGGGGGGAAAVVTGDMEINGAAEFSDHVTFNGGITTTSITAGTGQFGSINSNSHSH